MNKFHKLDKDRFFTAVSRATPLLAALAKDTSLSKAAEQLGVQQSAISHRLRQLEENLGFELIERTTRKSQLTPYGHILCQCAENLWDRLDQAYDQLIQFQSTDSIRLSVSSSLAMKWLLPHLSDAADAGLDLMLDVNDQALDFETAPVDVAIRFGRGPYPGLHSSLLSKAELIPVASPQTYPNEIDLAQQTKFLMDRAGLTDRTDFNWDYYKTHHKITFDSTQTPLSFDRADLMLQAAINGMGIALGRTLLIEKDIENGFLKPVGPGVALTSAYWVVARPAFARTERFDKLLDWLKSKLKH